MSATSGLDRQARTTDRPATPASPAIAIVVLTWNGRDDTLACLERLVPQLGEHDRVLLVDNGSSDGTVAAARTRFRSVETFENGTNLGFAGGNDVGLRRALAAGFPWVLLFNNDTVPPPDLLASLRRHAALASAEVVALQPVLVRAADPARIDSAGHRVGWLPSAKDLWAGLPVSHLPTEPFAVFGACGAAALLRAEALVRVGLLDEDLFVLFEDVDLAFRLRAAGGDVLALPDVRVPHRRGVSARRGRAELRLRRFWVQRNLVALALRWWPWPALLCAAPLLVLRAAQALWLAPRRSQPTSLWWRSLRQRRRNRRGMRAAGVDRWLGRGPWYRAGRGTE